MDNLPGGRGNRGRGPVSAGGGTGGGVVAPASRRVRRVAATDGVRRGGRAGDQRLADRWAGRGVAGGGGILHGHRGVHLGDQPERTGGRGGRGRAADARPVPGRRGSRAPFSGDTTTKTSPTASKRSRLERATGSASSSRPSDSRFQATIRSCTAGSQPWPAGSGRYRAWLRSSSDRSAPSGKSAVMNHSQAIPDASDSAASASPVVTYQSSAARRLPDSVARRSRHIGPAAPRRPWWACSASCR
jgi:hypothetical protein